MRLTAADPPPPVHSIVEKDDGSRWYRGADGLWFCITWGRDEEDVRWGQLAHGSGVRVVWIDAQPKIIEGEE